MNEIEFKIIGVNTERDYFTVEIEFTNTTPFFNETDRTRYTFPLGEGWDYEYADGTPKYVKQIIKYLSEMVEHFDNTNIQDEMQILQKCVSKKYKVCKNSGRVPTSQTVTGDFTMSDKVRARK